MVDPLSGTFFPDGGPADFLTDGESLMPVIAGGARTAPVLMEYAAEGSCAPLAEYRAQADARWVVYEALRKGAYTS